MADAVAISSTLSREGGRGAGGLISDISNLRKRHRLEGKQQRVKLTQFPRVTFKSLQLLHNMWLTFLIHCTTPARICQACVPMVGIKLVPPSVFTARLFPELHKVTFYFRSFPSLCLSFGVFCPTLGVPPVVCHGKIAQLLLH